MLRNSETKLIHVIGSLVATLVLQAFSTSAYGFYSATAEEYEVEYVQNFRSKYTSIEEFSRTTSAEKQTIIYEDINFAILSAFGPLNARHLGGPLKFIKPDMRWHQPSLVNGRVQFPIYVRNRWLLEKGTVKSNSLRIPMVLNESELRLMSGWEKCSDKDHPGYLWYYWDPSRSGCPHKLGVNYEMVDVKILGKTSTTKETFPAYEKLVRIENGEPTISMSFAFGYANMPENPNPETDNEWGAKNYRKMIQAVRSAASSADKKFSESPVKLDKITIEGIDQLTVGKRFVFYKDGLRYRISVYMENKKMFNTMFFLNSLAVENDSLFVWMGHSQLGTGFDPELVEGYFKESPQIFKVSQDYQLVYWGGCSSYSYYGYPLIELREKFLRHSGKGSEVTDIITNGLPSSFGILPDQSIYLMNLLLNRKNRPSFQKIVQDLDGLAKKGRVKILVSVLGDEDNN